MFPSVTVLVTSQHASDLDTVGANVYFTPFTSFLAFNFRHYFSWPRLPSNLEHLQRSVDPSILPAQHGGVVFFQDCIANLKELVKNHQD